MRLEVQDHGSIMLSYPWSQEGASAALPRIQQIFKRWAGGQITLAAAAQSANTSSSHQQVNITQLMINIESLFLMQATRHGRSFISLSFATAVINSKAAPQWTVKRSALPACSNGSKDQGCDRHHARSFMAS